MAKRTLRGWMEYLDDSRRELTESEFSLVMLFNVREYARVTMEQTTQTRAAAEHSEGMLGAVDELVARWAASQGIPYAGDGQVRAALDRQRDERRRLAEAERAKTALPYVEEAAT
jgi:hypothetical protein